MNYQDKPSVMVVDDEASNVFILKNILTDYTVNCAFSAKEMFENIDAAAPKVIILDVMLPNQNGFDIAKQLSSDKRYCSIHVIFLTAKTESTDVVKGFEHGGYDYIKKPFDEVELLARVEAAMKRAFEREKLESEVFIDPLTELYNRRYLTDYIRSESSRALRSNENFAVAMLDIDHFKSINDKLGHPCGDHILKEFARIIADELREYDVAIRYGGEEFLVVFPGESKINAVSVLERIQDKVLSGSYIWEDTPVSFSFTAGIADYMEIDHTSMPFEDLINKADHRLYHGKHDGRNCIVINDD